MKTLYDLYGKKLLQLTILLLLILSLLSVLNVNMIEVSAAESPYIAVVPESTVDPTLTPGKNYTVSMYTDCTNNDIFAYQFTLKYNPSVLEGIEVINGDLIVGGSAQFLAGPFNNTVGELSLTVGFFFNYNEGEVTSGPGTLANVTFRVVDKGTSNITIGPTTKLKGWDAWDEIAYDIIFAAQQPTHIQHGYFDNRLPHDLAVGNVIAPAEAAVGQLVPINVTVANIGKSVEVANVTILYDSTYIDSQNPTLLAGASETVSFSWNTAGLVQGHYTINATATIPEDDDPTDNWNTTTFLVEHDVAVVNVTAPTRETVGSLVPVGVEVANIGSFVEVANVTILYDSTYIDSQNLTLLAGASETVSFSWNTAGLVQGHYTINATATIPEDDDPTDNWNTTTILLVEHDVAVVNVTAPTKEIVGSLVSINVTIANIGVYTEVANVTVRHDLTHIDSQNVTVLDGEEKTVSFSWNTAGVAAGNYTLNATATLMESIHNPEGIDDNPTDNWDTTTISLVAHDVVVTRIEVPTTVTPGDTVPINITIENIGSFPEVTNVTVRYGSMLIGFNDTVQLLGGESETVSFSWNTAGLVQGHYTINATATIPEDDDPTDNWKNATILIAMHDIAVQSIIAPTSAYVGELATIVVLVKNLGWYEETFVVKVTYDTTGIIETPKSVTLLSQDLENIEFSWNTTGVAPASYTITAEAILDGDTHPTDNRKTRDNPVTVELPLGAIAGTVTDSSNNNPIESANVTANGYSDITDDNGHYNIADVPAGTYTVTASANGYQTSSATDIIVDTGETTTVNLELTPLVSINGKVIDASTRDPIAGATVTADGNSATADVNGEYTLPNVLPGDYTVTASAAKYLEQSKTVTLTAGMTTTLNFELTLLNGTISGTVKDSSTGNPISEATVTTNGMSATADSSGTYVISDVPAGTYNVTVSADGYQSSSQTYITVTAGETTIADFELTPVQPLNLLLYAAVAAVAIVFIAGTALYIFKIRKPT